MTIEIKDHSIPVNLGVNMHLQAPREMVDIRYTESACLGCYKITINHGVKAGKCQWQERHRL